MIVPAPEHIGYPVLGLLILGECAGVPLPGETALITAGGLAGDGHLSLPLVILVAASAAIVGDTLGYLLGRRRGRSFLLRDGWMAEHRRQGVARADRFFARYGALTVFFGRWLPGVRIVAAVMAGATQMPWRRFAVANALGAFAWASTVAGLASLVGTAGALTFAAIGFVIAGIGFAAGAARERTRRRQARTPPV